MKILDINYFFSAVVNMTTEYKLYKRRWLFLITVASLNMICMFISVGFSPVASLVTQYYKITGHSLPERVILSSIKPNYDSIFFWDLPE